MNLFRLNIKHCFRCFFFQSLEEIRTYWFANNADDHFAPPSPMSIVALVVALTA